MKYYKRKSGPFKFSVSDFPSGTAFILKKLNDRCHWVTLDGKESKFTEPWGTRDSHVESGVWVECDEKGNDLPASNQEKEAALAGAPLVTRVNKEVKGFCKSQNGKHYPCEAKIDNVWITFTEKGEQFQGTISNNDLFLAETENATKHKNEKVNTMNTNTNILEDENGMPLRGTKWRLFDNSGKDFKARVLITGNGNIYIKRGIFRRKTISNYEWNKTTKEPIVSRKQMNAQIRLAQAGTVTNNNYYYREPLWRRFIKAATLAAVTTVAAPVTVPVAKYVGNKGWNAIESVYSTIKSIS